MVRESQKRLRDVDMHQPSSQTEERVGEEGGVTSLVVWFTVCAHTSTTFCEWAAVQQRAPSHTCARALDGSLEPIGTLTVQRHPPVRRMLVSLGTAENQCAKEKLSVLLSILDATPTHGSR
jgi:hypothetical protein